MRQLWQDLRYSVRTLSKSPGFLAVAVLTLALGIGANTAIFAVVNAVILQSLPVAHPEQLALLTDPDEAATNVETTQYGERSLLSYPEFTELRAHNSVFSGMFAAMSVPAALDVAEDGNGAETTKARVQLVSGEFFDLLGVQPARGRAFTAEEDKAPGANPVAVLSNSFWRRQFDANPAIIGKSLRVGGGIFRVIGVAPEGFHGILVGSDAEIWLPISMQAQALPGRDYLKPRDTLWLQVMGRLLPGMSLERAQAGINVGLQQVLREWMTTESTRRGGRDPLQQRIKLHPGATGASHLRGQFSDPLKLLMAMVGLVLLIACANIANLMLARASGRHREVGIRLALGAGRGRIVRQLLTESLLIATLGGTFGIALAFWTTNLLLALVRRGFDGVALDPAHDLRVFLFTAAATLFTGLLFGIGPALRAARQDLNSAIGSNVRGAAGVRGRLQAGRLLVVAQISMSLLLCVGAALFVRTLHNLLNVNLGIDREHLLMARIDPSAAGYTQAALPVLCERLRERLKTIPGVRAVSLSNDGFFSGDEGDSVAVDGALKLPDNQMSSLWTLIGPDYLRAAGIPLLRGRAVDESDMAAGRPVCMVNQAFVKRFFGDASPLGHHVTDLYPTTVTTFEIVGVVADVQEHSLRGTIRPRFYGNYAHPIGTLSAPSMIVSVAGDPAKMIETTRRAIAAVDPSIPVLNIRTLDQQLDRGTIVPRLTADLSACFGGLALLMAAIGLYGVMSYSTARRTAEIGIRMALGASHGSVLWMVMRETLLMLAIGTVFGLAGAYWLGRLAQNMLFGLKATDPLAAAVAVGVMALAAALAGFIPARRAARLDPLNALRCE
jgi:predicted permease